MRNNKVINSTANRKPIKVFEGQGAPFLNKCMLFLHMQSVCGWNSSWRKLRGGNSNVVSQSCRRRGYSSQKVKKLFLPFKRENTQDENNTCSVTVNVSKSHSRDILPSCALLFLEPWRQSLPWELWQMDCWINWFCFEILAWFSREKGFSCPFLWTTLTPE